MTVASPSAVAQWSHSSELLPTAASVDPDSDQTRALTLIQAISVRASRKQSWRLSGDLPESMAVASCRRDSLAMCTISVAFKLLSLRVAKRFSLFFFSSVLVSEITGWPWECLG